MSASSTSSTPPDITPSVVPNGAPPPGHESHFDEAAPSQAWIPLLAVYTTLPVAIALVLLRVYVRIRLRDGLASEDYLCILAGFRPVVYILQSFQDLLTLFPHLSGVLGRHAWDIPEAVITAEVMKEISATTMMNLLAAASIKYSLLVLFRRIFSPLPRSKLMIRIGIIFTSVSFVVLSVVWIVYSVPLPGEGGWDSRIFREREGSATPLISMALGAVNTFLDFYLVAVSLSSISALKLSLSRKIGVSAVFATGLLYRICQAYLEMQEPDGWWRGAASSGAAPPPARDYDLVTGDISGTGRLRHVPRVNLGTLRSLFRDPGTSQRESRQRSVTVTRATEIELSPYTELRSVDMDYHRYLVNGHQKPNQYTSVVTSTGGSGQRS
ncbi:hypothetical protein PG991_013229 [Apiospora marii]|uniref:Rhodopsin domain-containing protein n=1 Tax=Apiospora marii TaxID=335849 RepID=A0ABR1R680_9PEZI